MSTPDMEGPITARQVGQLLDALDDPVLLSRRLGRLAAEHPEHHVPDARRLHDDLTEALRRTRAATPHPSELTERRHQLVELLVSGLGAGAVASRLCVSQRTFYRMRQDALGELLPVLDQMWSSHRATTGGAARAATRSDPGSEAVPRPAVFVGRTEELRTATELLHRHRLLIIGGPAGIGKTSLAAMLAQRELSERPVLWHRLRPGLTDSVGGMLFALGQRLAQLEAPALLAFMHQTSLTSTWQPIAHSLAVQSVQETGMVIVVDEGDVVSENPEVCSLLGSLHSECPACRIVVTARDRMPPLRDAARIELQGLDLDDATAYLAAHGLGHLDAEVRRTLVTQTGGSPQLLHLATGALLHAQLDPLQLQEQLLDAGDMRAFLFDQIYRHLTPGEQLVLGAASRVRRPVTAAFLAGALDGLVESIPSVLATLGRRFLLTPGAEGLRLHSSIREFAWRMLAPGDLRRLHRRLATAYGRAAQLEEACHHWLEAGEVEQARDALLGLGAQRGPHAQTRIMHLVERLRAAGLEDDPLLGRLAQESAAGAA